MKATTFLIPFLTLGWLTPACGSGAAGKTDAGTAVDRADGAGDVSPGSPVDGDIDQSSDQSSDHISSTGDLTMDPDLGAQAEVAGPAATVTVLGGATVVLDGGCRIGASDVRPGRVTIAHDTPSQASIRQVVGPGDLVIACAKFYRVVELQQGGGAGGGVGSGGGAVVLDSRPVVVPGLELRADGLVLATGGALYLGPGKSELTDLSISGDTASFKAGSRTGTGPQSNLSILAGATVEIDGVRYGAAKVVPRDPGRGLTGWVELVLVR